MNLMPQESFRVDPTALDSFRKYLTNVTMPELDRAVSAVRRLSDVDINAFGVCFGQLLGIPTRVAMGTAADHLADLTQQMAEVAKVVRDGVDTYEQVDLDNARRVLDLVER
jgi:hypothetical protein